MASKPALPHSELTQKLIAIGDQIHSLIPATTGGVHPEGGVVANPLQLQPGTITQTPIFHLGDRSMTNLLGVHPKLVALVERAIGYSTQDFTVYEGLRTPAQQIKNVKRGVSKTMDSQHIIQNDGYGHAVDLVPVIGGIPKWDWDGCYRIALAMDKAATEMQLASNIRWGGCWDKRLSDFGGDVMAYKKATQDYCARHPGPDFLDGPHFEIRF